MNRKFILASGSPRRKELLALIVPEYEVFPADIDETLPEGLAAEESAEFLALQKAAHVSEKFPGSIVIGCDTVVISEGEVLGKPADISDAERMLKKLSGKIHTVITGVCISCGEHREHFSCKTAVEFYPLSESEIADYISTGEPMDKAGGYGIQGKGSVLVKAVNGDFFNVVGLPVSMLKRRLDDFPKTV